MHNKDVLLCNDSLSFDITNDLQKKITESVGRIELVSIQSSNIFVVVARTEDEGSRLYNDFFNSGIENLSLYELAIPLLGVDLEATSMSHLSLIGKYVKVTEKDGRALKAEYLGDHSSTIGSPTTIPRDLFFAARRKLLTDNKEQTVENLREEFRKLGMTDRTITQLFGVDLVAAMNNVILWAGDSYYQKDTGKADMKEVIIDPPEFLKYLNKKPLKVKACHKFNKLFTGR
jgi:hypothetical protein